MAVSSSTVVAPVRGYHACMDQQKAKIDTALFFECELGEYVIIEGVRIYSLFHNTHDTIQLTLQGGKRTKI